MFFVVRRLPGNLLSGAARGPGLSSERLSIAGPLHLHTFPTSASSAFMWVCMHVFRRGVCSDPARAASANLRRRDGLATRAYSVVLYHCWRLCHSLTMSSVHGYRGPRAGFVAWLPICFEALPEAPACLPNRYPSPAPGTSTPFALEVPLRHSCGCGCMLFAVELAATLHGPRGRTSGDAAAWACVRIPSCCSVMLPRVAHCAC